MHKRSLFLIGNTGQNRQADLIHRLRSGEKRAFAEFVEKYQQQIFMCCRLLGLDACETEDVASETFLAAYQGISRYSGGATLSTWLWKITYNKAITFLRQKIRNYKLQQNLQSHYKDEQTTAPSGDDNAEIVWDTVKKLPPDQAMAIVLFYRQEKSVKDISDIMKKSQNTVKTNLFRGREKLKEMLGDKIERLY
jgi:RNA polymerase sigma-70 factor, ECF subfamily